MDLKLEKKLMNEFPFMESKDIHDKPTGNPIHCECSDGWFQLIWDLCEELTELYNKNNVPLEEIFIFQVKQKYAGLRFYTSGLIKGATAILNKYEDLSTKTCEVCGDIDYSNIIQFIIESVQNESEGFQYVVDYEIIEDVHEIKFDDEIIKQVEELLWSREEVADVEFDDYGFDIVLCTDYAPNYIEEEW